jgi:hypothetical protein
MPAQFTLPPDTRAVGTGNPPQDMNGVVDTVTAMGAVYSVLNTAYAGGADPTGVADSTAAINAAVAAAAAAGRELRIPAGTYKITSALNWKLDGLRVRGDGPLSTVISQATSNTPVVQVAGRYQDISGIQFAYATQQTSGQTAAIAMTFGDDTAGSCFEGNYHELWLHFAQTGMAIDPAVVTVAGMFSCRLADITVSEVSSSFIRLDGNNSNGNANCTGCVFENIFCSNTVAVTAAGFPVFLKNWDEFVFSQLNIEHVTVTAQDVLSLSQVGNAVFSSLHFESVTHSLNGGALLHLSGAGAAVINGLSARFNTYSGSSSNPVVKFFGTGPTTLIVNGSNESGCTVTTPSHPYADFGTATNCVAQVTGVAGSQTTAATVNAGAGDVAQFGLPAVTGVQALTSGFTSFATGGAANLLNSTSGSNTTMAAGTTYYAALWIPFNCTLTGIVVLTGTVGGTDNWIVALWNAAGGANLAHSALAGTAAPSSGTKIRIPFTAAVAVTGPAVYYIGLQSSGTTARFQGFGNVTEGFVTGSVSGTFGTLPSLSPGASYNQNVGPSAATY